MAGVSNFLAKQKKAELADLAESLGVEHDGLKKADLELELEEYLNKNSAKHSSDSRFATFYKKRPESSPVKKESSSALSEVESKAKQVRRRVTKAVEDATTDDSDAGSRSLTRTPRASALSNLSFASSVPLPPSPAVVAEAIDRRTQVLRSRVSDAFEESGLVERAHATRESLSTVASVQSLIVLFELYFLRPELLADRYAFTIPAIALLRTPSYAVKIPDLFLLLTASFWGPALLWAVATLVLPLTAAYFVNLTGKPRSRSHTSFSYTFDPLTFNIVKALLTFVIFGQDVTACGLINLEDVARINSALYGGYRGVLVGSAIGALVTLYEAIRK